jgi:DNA processing protein
MRLAEEIAQNGAVISEFPINTPPLRQNFPRRNRVISGLSQAVLVVEAAQNSGALITADFALQQGRDVFALPGKVDSATSFGTNALIKDGAKLVSDVADILEEFILPEAESKKAAKEPLKPSLGDEEDMVYSVLSGESTQIDELAQKTNLEIPKISGILLKLQLKKLVRELPGKQFVRSIHEG